MEKVVIVDRLVKNFEVYKRKPGILGAVSSLVTREEKTVKALKQISFSIKKGELVGFIGPNGAGKTTTLKILSGILYPTQGFVQVAGFTPWERRREFLKSISLVMGQKNQLWWDLAAMETFELNKSIYEIEDKDYRRVLKELVKLLEVDELLSIPVRRLSLGQRMRLELIAALLHSPQVLFLDEPTIGLDLLAQQKMRDFILDYNRRHQATILLTSHNMNDLVDLVRRVIVIDEGRIIFDGELAKLIARWAKEKTIKVSLSKAVNYKKLEEIGKITKINLPQIELSVPRSATAVAAAQILQTFPVADLIIEEKSIESVIRQVFKANKNE